MARSIADPISAHSRRDYDPNRYRPHLQDLDLTTEEQDAVIDALWHIMASFAELGFSSNPVATGEITCGQLLTVLFSAAQDGEDSVKYSPSKQQSTEDAARAAVNRLEGGTQ